MALADDLVLYCTALHGCTLLFPPAFDAMGEEDKQRPGT